MALKWNAKLGKFEPQGKRGKPADLKVRAKLDSARKSSKGKTFTVAVAMVNGAPDVTRGKVIGWCKANKPELSLSVFEYTTEKLATITLS